MKLQQQFASLLIKPKPIYPKNVSQFAAVAVFLLLCLAGGFVGFFVSFYNHSDTLSVITTTDGQECIPLTVPKQVGDYGSITAANVLSWGSGLVNNPLLHLYPGQTLALTWSPSQLSSANADRFLSFDFQSLVTGRWTMYHFGSSSPGLTGYASMTFQNSAASLTIVWYSALPLNADFIAYFNLTEICAPDAVDNACLAAHMSQSAAWPLSKEAEDLLIPLATVAQMHTFIRMQHRPFACKYEVRRTTLEVLSLSWASISFIAGFVFLVGRKATAYFLPASKYATDSGETAASGSPLSKDGASQSQFPLVSVVKTQHGDANDTSSGV